MKHVWIIAAAGLVLAGCSESGGKRGRAELVFEKPTVGTVGRGHPVLYDDGNCPPGKIARYKTGRRGVGLNRKCVRDRSDNSD